MITGRLWPYMALCTLGVLKWGVAPISAQGREGETRILADAEVGTEAGLGYKLPHILAGLALEKPLGTRWEAQGRVFWSPDRKYITNDGLSVQGSGEVLFWLNQKVALTGLVGYTHLWTRDFQKGAWTPATGVALRDRWYGSPGRAYFAYSFPTGCQWGSTCVIQSSRTHGITGYQEFRLWPHWRVGIRGAWWRFAEQSNPLDPAAGRVWHNTGTAAMVVRYEFRAESVDVAY